MICTCSIKQDVPGLSHDLDCDYMLELRAASIDVGLSPEEAASKVRFENSLARHTAERKVESRRLEREFWEQMMVALITGHWKEGELGHRSVDNTADLLTAEWRKRWGKDE